MAYAYLTLGQALTELEIKLYESTSDATQQFWSPSELTVYIKEALQCWNALTGFWRDYQTFTLSANNANLWYDLTTVSGSIRPMNTTDNAIIQTMEYHLLEPLTASYPLTWTGSNQFGVSAIINALQGQMDQLFGMSGCTITRATVAASGNNATVGDSVIDVRRVAWLPTTNNASYYPTPLKQSDDFALASFSPSWMTAANAVPSSWRISAQPPLSFYVDATPPVTGNYEILSVNAGPTLNSTASTTLSIPNDWCWVLKWGGLAQLLGADGLARDDLRAKYCAQRFDEGVALLGQAPALLALAVGSNANNLTPINVSSARDGDDYNPTWMNSTAAQPTSAYTAGLNVLGFPPLDSNYTAVAQVVENAPLPANNNANIQLGRDDLDAVLDYAQHLAAFKMGGAEFLATVPLYQAFLKQAALYNSKLQALGFFERQMAELSQLQAEREPVYTKGQGPGDQGGQG